MPGLIAGIIGGIYVFLMYRKTKDWSYFIAFLTYLILTFFVAIPHINEGQNKLYIALRPFWDIIILLMVIGGLEIIIITCIRPYFFKSKKGRL